MKSFLLPKYFIELPESLLNALISETSEEGFELWHPNLRLSPIGDVFPLFNNRSLSMNNFTEKRKAYSIQPRSFLQMKIKIHDPEDDQNNNEEEEASINGLNGENVSSHPHLYCKCKFVKASADSTQTKELPESPEQTKNMLFEPEKS